MTKLPAGWVSAPIGDFCQVIQGQSPPGGTYNVTGKGLPFLQGKAEFGDTYPKPVKWCTSPRKVAEADDVLISVRAPVGPTNQSPGRCCIGRGLAAIRPLGAIYPRYVLHGLRNSEGELAQKGTGSTFTAISGDVLREHELPIAPLPEQRRIVAEIEKQLTRLDVGGAALERLGRGLQRYRASVLNAARDGRLVRTEAELARKDKREYESADFLLKRIAQDRKATWEAQQLSRMRAAGKVPKDDGWKARYEEPEPAEGSSLPELPEGWVPTTLGEVTVPEIDQGGPTDAPEFLYVDIGSIDSRTKRISSPKNLLVAEAPTRARQRISRGDVLVSMTRPNLNAVAIVSENMDGGICSTGFRVLRAVTMSPLWLYCLVQSNDFVNKMSNTVQGVVYPAVRPKDIERYEIPLPPLAEQYRIVAEVDRHLSLIDEQESAVQRATVRAQRLRHAILRLAFEGRLVQQDPSDEPAARLLERISVTRAGGSSASLARKRATNSLGVMGDSID